MAKRGLWLWLSQRARPVVRRPSCSDVRCDDGIRLDTGADCDNCANILHSRRAWRVRIAAEVDQELPGLGTDARYREIEARMRRHAEAEAQERAQRRAAARAEAEAQAAIERERAAAEAAVRQAVACTDCGRERSAGLCEACDHRRQTETLIGVAGLLAAAGSADLSDPGSIAAAVAGARTIIGNSIAAAWQEFLQITDGGMLEADPQAAADAYAFTAFDTARQAVQEFQDTALEMLGRTEEAEAEARRAYRSEQRRPWFQRNPTGADAVAAATKAADTARERVAEYLLAARREQLHERSAARPERCAVWTERLPGLAARPLDGDAAAGR
ncbi:hypothetical protein ACFY5K_34920 [Streptomyces griseofuscus]|uniref:hypothetical protein n=1 Tax=Streptomyces griseofuscus TaxID=146922 RepID=UPI0036B7CCD1